MKVSADNRLPQATDATLAYSLYAIFRDFARGISYPNRIDSGGDIVIDAGGVVFVDTATPPHYWRVSVTTAGALVTTDLGTTRP